ncbi:SAF domain-containing protein, partial [Vibrio parahaemolyticus]|nr:SAF domain-containing protein [Vibrio parahaemolyticus]
DIKKGEELTEFNLTIKRPGSGLSPYRYWDLIGSMATKGYKAGELIIE